MIGIPLSSRKGTERLSSASSSIEKPPEKCRASGGLQVRFLLVPTVFSLANILPPMKRFCYVEFSRDRSLIVEVEHRIYLMLFYAEGTLPAKGGGSIPGVSPTPVPGHTGGIDEYL
ncbi:hypothetical protein [Halomonas cupida]|uniref:hypothetical protein n=1 Tax=Halomonas cupida TaxID=44933 RepID=UPI003A92ACD5